MSLTHRLLGVTVAVLWGFNFLAINASLPQFPPFFLVALRFLVLAIPTMLFIPRPAVPWRWLVLYGTGFGTLQMGFMYWGLAVGMPTGLASLVLQSGAPFTVVLGALFLRERLSRNQVAGIVLAVIGLGIVGVQRWQSADLLPFLLIVAAGFGWALGNLGSRLASSANPQANPVHLVLWMGVMVPVPMLVVSLLVEGPAAIAASFTGLGSQTGLVALVGLFYTVAISTLVATVLWTYLMVHHEASRVAPFSMLVPVVGISAAWLVLHEQPTVLELVGSALVVAGVLYGGSRSRLGLRRAGAAPAVGRESHPLTVPPPPAQPAAEGPPAR